MSQGDIHSVKMTVDDSEVVAAAARSVQLASQVEAAWKQAAAGMTGAFQGVGTATAGAASNINSFNKTVNNLDQSINQYNRTQNTTNQTLNQTLNATANLTNAYTQHNRTTNNLDQSTNQFNRTTNNLRNSYTQQNRQVNNLDASTRNYNRTVINIKEATNDADSSTMKLGGSLGSLAARFVSLYAVIGTGKKISDALAEGAEKARDMGQGATDLRDSLRAIRSLQGGPGGVTNELIQQHLLLRRGSGLTKEEAISYQERFLGEAEAYKAKLSPQEYLELQVRGAAAARATNQEIGPQASMLGRLLGLVPEGQKATPRGLVAQESEINRILELGSGDTPLLKQAFGQVLATEFQPGGGGNIADPRAGAIMAMAASRMTRPRSVPETIQRFTNTVRGLSGGTGWQEYVKDEMHINENMPAEQAMLPIFRRMEEWQKQGRDLNAVLMEEAGLKDVDARQTLVSMFSRRAEMAKEMAKGPGHPDVMTPEKVELFTKQGLASPEAQNAVADARIAEAEFNRGLPLEQLNIFRKKATARLIAQGKIRGEQEAALMLRGMIAAPFGIGVTPEQRMIDEMVPQIFKEETGRDMHKEEVLTPNEKRLAGLFGIIPGGSGVMEDWMRAQKRAGSNQTANELEQGLHGKVPGQLVNPGLFPDGVPGVLPPSAHMEAVVRGLHDMRKDIQQQNAGRVLRQPGIAAPVNP